MEAKKKEKWNTEKESDRDGFEICRILNIPQRITT